MLLAQRNHDPVVGRRSLQFEIEGHAEPLPQGEAPGPVDPAPEWRVQDQLHPAAFIEKPLCDDRLLRRHGSQDRDSGCDVVGSLFRATLIERAFTLDPADG